MATGIVNVLSIIDTTSIQSGGQTWYLCDDDSSSLNEGSSQLTSICSAGDTIYFRCAPTVTGQQVEITGVGAGPTGAYVFGFNKPISLGGGVWSWQTQNQGQGSYSLRVLAGGVTSYVISGHVTAGPPSAANKTALGARAVHQIVDVVVAVDTLAILAGAQVGQGQGPVYMVDNNQSAGSGPQGSPELNTHCNAGDTIRWHVVPINGTDSVIITGFQQSQPGKGVFGQNSPAQQGDSYTWLTASAGQETYQIRLLVNGVQTFSWDPFISAGPPQAAQGKR